MKVKQKDIKRIFWKQGTCSRTLFYILNREFDHPMEPEECAADPLAGGIAQQGYQCGMLWGSSLAAGAESYRRNKNAGLAIGITIKTVQNLMESFSNRTGHSDCFDITSCDFKSKLGVVKLLISGRFLNCFKLAEKWAPEAIQAAEKGLSSEYDDLPQSVKSCASEVARKMGANDEEMVMVSGFAGGLGLSGNACGALSAAIWMNTLEMCKKQNVKSAFRNPNAAKILETFYKTTDYEILCEKITGRNFKTIDEHTEFIEQGGCDKLITILAQA